uniref:Gamma-aminobutyric acid receptor subunit alpha-6 n=1 Tax=Hirondellea gigas TaxID=1518452 RepID=A0A6A7G5N9_9CRUS
MCSKSGYPKMQNMQKGDIIDLSYVDILKIDGGDDKDEFVNKRERNSSARCDMFGRCDSSDIKLKPKEIRLRRTFYNEFLSGDSWYQQYRSIDRNKNLENKCIRNAGKECVRKSENKRRTYFDKMRNVSKIPLAHVYPTTFPTVFTKSQLIFVCLFVILSSIGRPPPNYVRLPPTRSDHREIESNCLHAIRTTSSDRGSTYFQANCQENYVQPPNSHYCSENPTHEFDAHSVTSNDYYANERTSPSNCGTGITPKGLEATGTPASFFSAIFSGLAPSIGGGALFGGFLLADAYSSTYNAKDFSRNVTQLLDSLLDDYDKRFRPGHGGPPTKIIVNMNVRSMGPFSEKKEEYAMQLYMRQFWYDSRLRFNKTDLGRSEFSMNWVLAQRIWKPDTFFINGKKSYAHSITAPNLFVRMQYDGQIYMSMRLTVRASCVMHLRRFPLDTQICPLRLSSYGYSAKDIIYKWDQKKFVTVDSDVSIAQYELSSIVTSEAQLTVRRTEEISTLTVKFSLIRLTGFFILQVYVPCILIVFSSWVGFWITKKDAPGRVCLGVNNVLCMTKLGFGGRDIFPLVSYPTALDYFVLLCFWFTFATIIEYAAINYLERYAITTVKRLKERREKLKQEKAHLAKLAREGAGCINVTTKSIHTSILESFRLHIVAAPYVVNAAYTSKPNSNQKGKLFQALKLPLTVVPKVADEAKGVDSGKVCLALPGEEISVSEVFPETESVSSLSPKPYTPRLLQRLAVLRRTSSPSIHEEETQPPSTSPQPSPHSSLKSLFYPTRPLPSPSQQLPGQPPVSSPSVTSSQASPSQELTTVISEQETPQMSPRISPMTTTPTTGPPLLTITTTPPPETQDTSPVTSLTSPPETDGDQTKSPPGSTDTGKEAGAGGAGSVSPSITGGSPGTGDSGTKPSGTLIKVEGDEDPPPPPAKRHTVTIWQLLIRKRYLMRKMTPDFELPNEEDLLDRFNIIDIYARRIFPTFFFAIFSIYWILFNYYISDEFPHEPRIPSDGLVN